MSEIEGLLNELIYDLRGEGLDKEDYKQKILSKFQEQESEISELRTAMREIYEVWERWD